MFVPVSVSVPNPVFIKAPGPTIEPGIVRLLPIPTVLIVDDRQVFSQNDRPDAIIECNCVCHTAARIQSVDNVFYRT